MLPWSLLLLGMLPAADARLCRDLVTGAESLSFARTAYNCSSILEEFEYMLESHLSTACPVGFQGITCAKPCDAVYAAILNHATDARRCGCFSDRGCRILDRPVLASLDTPVRGVALLPDDARLAGRIVPCEQQNCDPAHPAPARTADVFACEDAGEAFAFCPRCAPLCHADPHADCALTADRGCDVACEAGFWPEDGRVCRRCRACLAHEEEVAPCDPRGKDRICAVRLGGAHGGERGNDLNNASGWTDRDRCLPGFYANASTGKLCCECQEDFASSPGFDVCLPCPDRFFGFLVFRRGNSRCIT